MLDTNVTGTIYLIHTVGRILEEVKPLRMIVLGLKAWNELPSADVGEGLGAMAFGLSSCGASFITY